MRRWHNYQGRSRRACRAARVLGGAAASLLIAGSASASPRGANNPSQAGISFYAGKTITLIVPSAPGGGFDGWGRLVAPAVGIYLHARVVVENVPGAATIVGQDQAFHSPADGLTIGMVSAPTDVTDAITNVPGVNFNPERLAFLAGTVPTASCIVSSAVSPYATFGEVIHSPTTVVELAQTEGVVTDETFLMNSAFGIDAKVIDSYAATANTVQGFIRGDGQLINNSLSSVGSLIAGGKARCLVATNPAPRGLAYSQVEKGIPTLQQVAKLYPPKTHSQKAALAALEALYNTTSQIFAVPGGVAPSRVAALRAAFEFAMKNGAVRQGALNEGLNPGWVSGPGAKAQYLSFYKILRPVASDLPTS